MTDASIKALHRNNIVSTAQNTGIREVKPLTACTGILWFIKIRMLFPFIHNLQQVRFPFHSPPHLETELPEPKSWKDESCDSASSCCSYEEELSSTNIGDTSCGVKYMTLNSVQN